MEELAKKLVEAGIFEQIIMQAESEVLEKFIAAAQVELDYRSKLHL